jgi:type IV secretory pathway ATPase VirB11/archaellum biosynthesis ATPase
MFPPCAVGGPVLTIRKFTRRYSLQDLVDVGALTPALASELVAAVATQQNILISGGTGTGKTTLLNALAAHIPERDRVVVIEETAEIHLDKPNVLRLEARRAQAPLGQEAPLPPVTIADLLRAALRHWPDRILVGEVRDAEAFDLLQALNTGHLGSLSTIHANSGEQAFTRLAHCVLASNVALPHRSTREAIALAIHLVVHIARVDGHRRVTERAKRRDSDRELREHVAEAFLADKGQRAIAHPPPTPKRCCIITDRGRYFFDVATDQGLAKDVPAEAHRRFRADLRSKQERDRQDRAAQLALHEEKKRFIADWIALNGTDEKRTRQADGVLPMEEAIEAITDQVFSPLCEHVKYVRDGIQQIRAPRAIRPSRRTSSSR